MTPNVLFVKEHIYDFIEAQQKRCQRAYEALSDEDAMNEAMVQKLKAQFALEIPVLRRDKMDYEENHRRLSLNEFSGRNVIGPPGQAMRNVTEYVIHVPFEGDPKVFDLCPSAYNGTVALGEIVGHEILLRVSIDNPNIDVQGLIDREVEKIDWRLRNLRGSSTHLEEQLNRILAMCTGARRRMMENRANATIKLNLPKRSPAPVPVQTSSQQPSETEKKTSATRNKGEKWDVFISHASEDKPYVDPLANALEDARVSVWYDTLVLEWGDDLRTVIDKGLINCRYGIVVLSKAFLGKKKWTEHELNGLFAREQAGRKLILPIWHGIMRDDLLQYSPALADRLAKIAGSDSYENIVHSLLDMLGRPVSQQNKAPKGANLTSGPITETIAVAQHHGPDEEKVKRSEPAQPARQRIAELGGTPNAVRGSDDLSPKEIELLWTAAQDPRGGILHSRTFDSESIVANGRHFLKNADARTVAEWLGALRSLEDRGFIEPLSIERSFFKLTDNGYGAADLLDEFARWNTDAIILRAHYMNAPSEQHTLACNTIVAIPARYFKDQIGADGSVMRTLRERRSLLVEGIDGRRLGSWNPNEVEFIDTVDGRVERFRVDGMEFLGASCLKLPILD